MKVHLRNFRFRNLVLLLLSICSALAMAEPVIGQVGQGLYAYISDNDASANCTFLVGDAGILVVDTGLNATEGSKLLGAIRIIRREMRLLAHRRS
jgi:hypothetical protein